jgi:hypothetical protein
MSGATKCTIDGRENCPGCSECSCARAVAVAAFELEVAFGCLRLTKAIPQRYESRRAARAHLAIVFRNASALFDALEDLDVECPAEPPAKAAA